MRGLRTPENLARRDVELYRYLHGVLVRMVDEYPVNRLDELLRWNGRPPEAVNS